jgi:hypothetical protein
MSQEIDLEEKSDFYGEAPCSSPHSSPNRDHQESRPVHVVAGGLFNPKQFKSPAYYIPHPFLWLDSVSTQVNESGYIPLPGKIQHVDTLPLITLPLIVLTFIDASAHSQGVPRHLSSYLVAIANAGSGVGRLSGGFIADRVGACIPPDMSSQRTL